MMPKALEIAFEKAVLEVNGSQTPLPQDTMLKLYALYKIATRNQENPSGDKPLISAFKSNALFQAKHLSREDAMQQYIEIVSKDLANT